MNNHADQLRIAAQEVADGGHNGWGNLMNDAADEITNLRAFIGRQFSGFDVDEAIDLHGTVINQTKETSHD